MMASDGKRGRLVFFIILLLVMVIALAAYQLSGNMGIEERFSHAVGLEQGEEEEGGGWSGFTLEGIPVLYAVVLGILVIGCYAAYRCFLV